MLVGPTLSFGQFNACKNNNDDPPPYNAPGMEVAGKDDLPVYMVIDANSITDDNNDFCIGNSGAEDTDSGCGTFIFKNLSSTQDGCGTQFCFTPRQGCGNALGNVCFWREDPANPGSWLSLGSFESTEDVPKVCLVSDGGADEYAITVCRPGNGPVSLVDVEVTPPPVMEIDGAQNICIDDLPATIDLTTLEPSGFTGGTWTPSASLAIPATATAGATFTATYCYDATSDVGYTCELCSDVTYTITEDCCVPPATPTTACYEKAIFNDATCMWEVTGTQPSEPATECWETATFDNTTCQWVVTGSQETAPTIECWETATFDNTTCQWVVTLSLIHI